MVPLHHTSAMHYAIDLNSSIALISQNTTATETHLMINSHIETTIDKAYAHLSCYKYCIECISRLKLFEMHIFHCM